MLRVEDGFCKASGLKERKAQQCRIAHASPGCLADVRAPADAFYQNGVNRRADDDEKAQREQGAKIVLVHAARFPVEDRRHRDRRDGSG